MYYYIKLDCDVNSSDIRKLWKNRRFLACPPGAYSAELVQSVESMTSTASDKDEKTALKVIEGAKK